MRVEWISPSSDRWEEVLATARHDFYHLPAYVLLSARTEGGTAGGLLIEDGDAWLWPLLERRIPNHDSSDLTSPYGYPGPICTSADARVGNDLLHRGLAMGLEVLRARGCLSLFSRLHPVLNAQLAFTRLRGLSVVEHGATVSIDLRIPVDESFSQYRKIARHDVRACQRLGYTVHHDQALERIDEFVALYIATMTRIGASSFYMFPPSYFEGLRQALGPRLSLWFAERDGRIGAAALFTEVCGVLQYHLSASDAELSREHPTKLLIDAARIWGHGHGAELLHLGGGVGGNNTDPLFFFKSGFSPRRHAFRTVRAVLDEDAYDRLSQVCSSGGGAPLASGFFPAYRAPQ